MTDDFFAGLCDVHLKTHDFMQAEIRRLRLENAVLKRQINEMPSTLTDLQDRVTMLESDRVLQYPKGNNT